MMRSREDRQFNKGAAVYTKNDITVHPKAQIFEFPQQFFSCTSNHSLPTDKPYCPIIVLTRAQLQLKGIKVVGDCAGAFSSALRLQVCGQCGGNCVPKAGGYS